MNTLKLAYHTFIQFYNMEFRYCTPQTKQTQKGSYNVKEKQLD